MQYTTPSLSKINRLHKKNSQSNNKIKTKIQNIPFPQHKTKNLSFFFYNSNELRIVNSVPFSSYCKQFYYQFFIFMQKICINKDKTFLLYFNDDQKKMAYTLYSVWPYTLYSV